MNKAEKSTKLHKILTVIGWVLCIILVPILIVNCTLLIKSAFNKNKVPDFGGTVPFIVLTDSMYPDIKSGDLILCKTIEPEDVEVDDVISFYDPAGNGTSVVTHKVIEIVEEDGALFFRTKGINNNTEDRVLVPADKVIAEYSGIRIPGAGNLAIFMQSTAGLLVCVVLPIILFVGYDVVRRKLYEKNKGDDMAALKAELEALKAAKQDKPQLEQSDTEPAPETPTADTSADTSDVDVAALMAELEALKAAAAAQPQAAAQEETSAPAEAPATENAETE